MEAVKDTRRRLRRSVGTMDAARVDDDDGSQQ